MPISSTRKSNMLANSSFEWLPDTGRVCFNRPCCHVTSPLFETAQAGRLQTVRRISDLHLDPGWCHRRIKDWAWQKSAGNLATCRPIAAEPSAWPAWCLQPRSKTLNLAVLTLEKVGSIAVVATGRIPLAPAFCEQTPLPTWGSPWRPPRLVSELCRESCRADLLLCFSRSIRTGRGPALAWTPWRVHALSHKGRSTPHTHWSRVLAQTAVSVAPGVPAGSRYVVHASCLNRPSVCCQGGGFRIDVFSGGPMTPRSLSFHCWIDWYEQDSSSPGTPRILTGIKTQPSSHPAVGRCTPPETGQPR